VLIRRKKKKGEREKNKNTLFIMSSKRGDKKNQKIPKMEQHFLIGPKIGYLIFLFFQGFIFFVQR